MTVRKAATFGFDDGKGAVRAASGVVVPHREFHPPAPDGEWMSGEGTSRLSGGSQSVLADVGLAHHALGPTAALAIQGEAFQQVSMQGVQARAAGAARQDFVKPLNKPETDWGRFGRQGQYGSEGTGQHHIPASSKEKPAGAAGGTLNAAPAGNTAALLAAATWTGLPGQGGAEKGEERPARRRVWPVAPGVPASSRESARARRGEGAALVMRRTKANVDQGLSVRRDLGRELFQHGRRQGSHQEQRRHLIQQFIRIYAALSSHRPQASGRLEADLPGAVVAVGDRAPRRHGYGASGCRTKTSCRSGRSSETGTTPRERRSTAMARSVGHRSEPLSSVLIRPGD